MHIDYKSPLVREIRDRQRLEATREQLLQRIDAAERLMASVDVGQSYSDMNMPLLSGIDLFRELRAQGSTLPFILLTGDEPEGLLAQEPRRAFGVAGLHGIEDRLVLLDRVVEAAAQAE